jgi:hypothetical protein
MNITKDGNKIIIEITPLEDRAVSYFMRRRGITALEEYFAFFFESRITTMEDEISRSLFQASTDAEKEAILSRIP